MNITDPIRKKGLDDALALYGQACAKFEAARDIAYQKKETVAQLLKSADDAEHDAKMARQTCIALMRDPATPSEKLRELRSIERSSYSIAEDYRIPADDMRWDADDAEIDATDTVHAIEPRRDAVLITYADIHLEVALKELDTLCRAIRLYAWAHGTDWALDTVFKRVTTVYHSTDPSFEGDEVINATQRPSGTNHFDPRKWTGVTLKKRAIAREKYNEARKEKTA